MDLRTTARAIALIFVAGSVALAASDDRALEKSVDFQKKAVACYQRKDWPGFLENSRRAEELLPGTPRLVYNLACAQALNGDAVAAAKHLTDLLDRGLDLGMEKDEDFAAVRESPAFRPVLRQLAALNDPVHRSDVAFRLAERDLITEGLAHDARTGAFFVSSVHHRKIVRREAGGSVSDFIAEGQDGIQGVLALLADSRRRVLWACSAAVPEMSGWDATLDGSTALFGYDLDTGKLVRSARLARDGKPHVFNDLALAKNGDVYTTDSAGSGLYRLRANGKALETFLPPGVFRSPQGMGFSADGRRLYVADYADGIWIVDLATRKREALKAPANVPLLGVDGLVVDVDGNQIIVTQNGIRPYRVARLDLTADGRRVARSEVLEKNTPNLEEPTLGVLVGPDFYYVANAQWDRFDAAHKILPLEKLEEPTILKVTLAPRRSPSPVNPH